MNEKCKSCSYTYPHIECVNCGEKHRNYKAYRRQTNADRIRSMGDEELAEFLLKWIACDKESHMCCPKEYKESGKCDGKCVAGRVAWLRQPAKEETT